MIEDDPILIDEEEGKSIHPRGKNKDNLYEIGTKMW